MSEMSEKLSNPFWSTKAFLTKNRSKSQEVVGVGMLPISGQENVRSNFLVLRISSTE